MVPGLRRYFDVRSGEGRRVLFSFLYVAVVAWSFANLLFDTRQARRLFGLIAVGGSLGSIGAGLLASVLVRPIGGTVNMMLVLAGLILAAAVIVAIAHRQLHVGAMARR